MASRRTGNDFLKTPYDHTQVLDPLPTLQELNGSGKLRRGNDSGEERTWGDARDGERQGTGKWWERLRGRESNLSDRRQQGDIANLSCLTLRNLPKSGHLAIYTVHSSNAVIGVQLHHMICLLFHYHHSTGTFICSTIQSFLQLPAASRILALAWRTRQKSEHLSTEARIVLNSEVYLVPHSETVLGPGSSGRLLA